MTIDEGTDSGGRDRRYSPNRDKPDLDPTDIELFKLLRENYFKMTTKLLKMCLAHDEYQLQRSAVTAHLAKQGGADPSAGANEQQRIDREYIKKIGKLRKDKMNMGALMRIVRSQNYDKMSNDLSEVDLIRRRVPLIKRYMEHFEKRRDEGRDRKASPGSGRSRSGSASKETSPKPAKYDVEKAKYQLTLRRIPEVKDS